MDNKCKVLDLFHPSSGDVAILDFSNGLIPKIGMIIQNTSNLKWRIASFGMPILLDIIDRKYNSHFGSEAVWDCTLIPVGHSESVKMDDDLEVVANT